MKRFKFFLMFLLFMGEFLYANLTQSEVSSLYVAILNRASEGEGNRFWQGYKSTLEETANAMLNTQDAIEYFGDSLDSNQAFIEHIYKNTLNKTYSEDPEGIKYWTKKLDSGESRGKIIADMVYIIKQYANTEDPLAKRAYKQFMNRVEVSDYTADIIEEVPENYKQVLGFDEKLNMITDDEDMIVVAENNIEELLESQEVINNNSSQVFHPLTKVDIGGFSIYKNSSTDCTFGGTKCGNDNTRGKFHRGVDLMVSGGTEVVAICDGEVIFNNTNYKPVSSSLLVIKHTCGTKTYYGYYGHIASKLKAKSDEHKGDTVSAGETIGQVKYWGIKYNNRDIDNSHLHMAMAYSYHTQGWGYGKDQKDKSDFFDFNDLISRYSKKPTILNFKVMKDSINENTVKVTFDIESDISLKRIRTHCGIGAKYKNHEFIDSDLDSRYIEVSLENDNWLGEEIYCKAEVINANFQKAQIIKDSVYLSNDINDAENTYDSTFESGEYEEDDVTNKLNDDQQIKDFDSPINGDDKDQEHGNKLPSSNKIDTSTINLDTNEHGTNNDDFVSSDGDPVVSNLIVKQWKNGYKYIVVKFYLDDADNSKMSTLRIHCATSKDYSTDYKYKDFDEDERFVGQRGMIISYDPYWNNKTVYCKIEAIDTEGNKALVEEDSVFLSY